LDVLDVNPLAVERPAKRARHEEGGEEEEKKKD
jgi:hypothetical protein